MTQLEPLHERIRRLAKEKNISLSKLAELVGEKQQTFQKWLKPDSEKNLYSRLPRILKLFPDVREEWLYIGREPVFKDITLDVSQPTKEEVEALKAENKRLKEELAEADRVNRKLTTKLFHDGVTDEKSVDATVAKAAGQE